MKTLVFISGIICVILGANLIYYIYKPEPVMAKIIEQKQMEKVIEMDRDIRNYTCINLVDLEYNILKYCVRKQPLDIQPGKAYVRGYYVPSENSIWLDANSPTDRKLHELIHWLDEKYEGRDRETRAYTFQDMYLKVNQL